MPSPTGALEWLKWMAIVAPLLFSAFVLFRSKTAAIWKEERDAALAKADRLASENKDLRDDKASLSKELEDCRHKTDLTGVLKQQSESHAMVLAAVERHASVTSLMDRHVGELTQVVRLLIDKVERL